MNRQMKAWQAILAIIFTGLGSYFGRDAVEPPKPPAVPAIPPEPIPPPKPIPIADPVAAIGRIQFGSSGCTATIIGDRRGDGRYDVLTASHCVTRPGQRGTMWLKDGRVIGVTVVVASAQIEQRGPDCCWLVTDSTTEVLPFARLAPRNPPVGAKVWHIGYGVDRPANREDGTVTAGEDAGGQLEFRISVSSGDSGGGVALDENGDIVGAVCCTTARGQVARVWACSPETAARLRPKETTSAVEWTPIDVPLVIPDVMPGRP